MECKIVNIFLSISFNISFGCSKEPSHLEIEAVADSLDLNNQNIPHQYTL